MQSKLLMHKELSQIDRIIIDLEILDNLKAATKEIPEGIADLHRINQTFQHVRHSLENEVRQLLPELMTISDEILRLQQENEGLRLMLSEREAIG